jgi:hypothetical protein
VLGAAFGEDEGVTLVGDGGWWGKQFCRVNGHMHLPALRAELRRVTAETVVPDHQNDAVNAA